MIVSFLEQRFPDDISYGSTGGPEFNTDVLTTSSGHEKRNINWANARGCYNVVHGVKSKEQMQNLLSFFRNCYGKAIGFRFKDWSDYQVDKQQLAIADGIATTFQLIKAYHMGEHTVERKITKPVLGSVRIFFVDNHHLRGKVEPSYSLQAVEVDHGSGIIKFPTPPKEGQVVYASFEFDIPARFDTDLLNASLDDYGVHSWSNISIIELKE